jgi:DNA-binding NtrC family response regulator
VASGTLPNELIEQELFGVDHGDSHSTTRPAMGRLLAARRGFVVIDEIDTLGSVQQAKLLHLIETGEFEPVGSGDVRLCQARLIVSSHQSLEPLVKQGRFSANLWDQLGRHQFVLPPLRRRPMDIVPLARKLLQHLLIKHRKPLLEIDAGLFTTLLEYPWPGNVRELEWVLEQTVIHCRAKQLGATHLPRHIVSAKSATMREVSPNSPSPNSDMSNNGVSNNGVSAEKWEPRPAIAAVSNGVDSSEMATSGFTQKEIFEQTLFKTSFHPKSSSRQSDSSRMMLYPPWKQYGSIQQENRHA